MSIFAIKNKTNSPIAIEGTNINQGAVVEIKNKNFFINSARDLQRRIHDGDISLLDENLRPFNFTTFDDRQKIFSFINDEVNNSLQGEIDNVEAAVSTLMDTVPDRDNRIFNGSGRFKTADGKPRGILTNGRESFYNDPLDGSILANPSGVLLNGYDSDAVTKQITITGDFAYKCVLRTANYESNWYILQSDNPNDPGALQLYFDTVNGLTLTVGTGGGRSTHTFGYIETITDNKVKAIEFNRVKGSFNLAIDGVFDSGSDELVGDIYFNDSFGSDNLANADLIAEELYVNGNTVTGVQLKKFDYTQEQTVDPVSGEVTYTNKAAYKTSFKNTFDGTGDILFHKPVDLNETKVTFNFRADLTDAPGWICLASSEFIRLAINNASNELTVTYIDNAKQRVDRYFFGDLDNTDVNKIVSNLEVSCVGETLICTLNGVTDTLELTDIKNGYVGFTNLTHNVSIMGAADIFRGNIWSVMVGDLPNLLADNQKPVLQLSSINGFDGPTLPEIQMTDTFSIKLKFRKSDDVQEQILIGDHHIDNFYMRLDDSSTDIIIFFLGTNRAFSGFVGDLFDGNVHELLLVSTPDTTAITIDGQALTTGSEFNPTSKYIGPITLNVGSATSTEARRFSGDISDIEIYTHGTDQTGAEHYLFDNLTGGTATLTEVSGGFTFDGTTDSLTACALNVDFPSNNTTSTFTLAFNTADTLNVTLYAEHDGQGTILGTYPDVTGSVTVNPNVNFPQVFSVVFEKSDGSFTMAVENITLVNAPNKEISLSLTDGAEQPAPEPVGSNLWGTGTVNTQGVSSVEQGVYHIYSPDGSYSGFTSYTGYSDLGYYKCVVKVLEGDIHGVLCATDSSASTTWEPLRDANGRVVKDYWFCHIEKRDGSLILKRIPPSSVDVKLTDISFTRVDTVTYKELISDSGISNWVYPALRTVSNTERIVEDKITYPLFDVSTNNVYSIEFRLKAINGVDPTVDVCLNEATVDLDGTTQHIVSSITEVKPTTVNANTNVSLLTDEAVSKEWVQYSLEYTPGEEVTAVSLSFKNSGNSAIAIKNVESKLIKDTAQELQQLVLNGRDVDDALSELSDSMSAAESNITNLFSEVANDRSDFDTLVNGNDITRFGLDRIRELTAGLDLIADGGIGTQYTLLNLRNAVDAAFANIGSINTTVGELGGELHGEIDDIDTALLAHGDSINSLDTSMGSANSRLTKLEEKGAVFKREFLEVAVDNEQDDWYTLAQVNDYTSPVTFNLACYAHTSVHFIITKGYQRSTITTLGFSDQSNSGFKFIKAIRVSTSGKVDIKLNEGSSVRVSCQATAASVTSGTPFLSELNVSTSLDEDIHDEVNLLDMGEGAIRAHGKVFSGVEELGTKASVDSVTSQFNEVVNGNDRTRFGLDRIREIVAGIDVIADGGVETQYSLLSLRNAVDAAFTNISTINTNVGEMGGRVTTLETDTDVVSTHLSEVINGNDRTRYGLDRIRELTAGLDLVTDGGIATQYNLLTLRNAVDGLSSALTSSTTSIGNSITDISGDLTTLESEFDEVVNGNDRGRFGLDRIREIIAGIDVVADGGVQAQYTLLTLRNAIDSAFASIGTINTNVGNLGGRVSTLETDTDSVSNDLDTLVNGNDISRYGLDRMRELTAGIDIVSDGGILTQYTLLNLRQAVDGAYATITSNVGSLSTAIGNVDTRVTNLDLEKIKGVNDHNYLVPKGHVVLYGNALIYSTVIPDGFTLETVDITTLTNMDHIWYNDDTNTYHMVADGGYQQEGQAGLAIGSLTVDGVSFGTLYSDWTGLINGNDITRYGLDRVRELTAGLDLVSDGGIAAQYTLLTLRNAIDSAFSSIGSINTNVGVMGGRVTTLETDTAVVSTHLDEVINGNDRARYGLDRVRELTAGLDLVADGGIDTQYNLLTLRNAIDSAFSNISTINVNVGGKLGRDEVTNLGKTSTGILTGEDLEHWVLPVGGSNFINASSSKLPFGEHSYWQVIGRRDVDGGYVGLLIQGVSGDVRSTYIGRAPLGTDFPTWQKLTTDADLATITSELTTLSDGFDTIVNGNDITRYGLDRVRELTAGLDLVSDGGIAAQYRLLTLRTAIDAAFGNIGTINTNVGTLGGEVSTLETLVNTITTHLDEVVNGNDRTRYGLDRIRELTAGLDLVADSGINTQYSLLNLRNAIDAAFTSIGSINTNVGTLGGDVAALETEVNTVSVDVDEVINGNDATLYGLDRIRELTVGLDVTNDGIASQYTLQSLRNSIDNVVGGSGAQDAIDQLDLTRTVSNEGESFLLTNGHIVTYGKTIMFSIGFPSGTNLTTAALEDITNLDHIWYDDSGDNYHLCADTTYKNTGNAGLYVGRLVVNGVSWSTFLGNFNTLDGNFDDLVNGNDISRYGLDRVRELTAGLDVANDGIASQYNLLSLRGAIDAAFSNISTLFTSTGELGGQVGERQAVRLPKFFCGSSSITDEYLIVSRYHTSGTVEATGLIGRIIGHRGATAAGNQLRDLEISIQDAYTTTDLRTYVNKGHGWQYLSIITVDSQQYVAIRAAATGGEAIESSLYFEGRVINAANDVNILTRVRESSANVTVNTEVWVDTMRIGGVRYVPWRDTYTLNASGRTSATICKVMATSSTTLYFLIGDLGRDQTPSSCTLLGGLKVVDDQLSSTALYTLDVGTGKALSQSGNSGSNFIVYYGTFTTHGLTLRQEYYLKAIGGTGQIVLTYNS